MTSLDQTDFREYLGDSVYVDFDGFHIVLTTDNGLGPTNTIALDDHVYANLLRYVERLKKHIQELKENKE